MNRERISPRLPVLAGVIAAALGVAHAAPYGSYNVTPQDDAGRVVPGFYPNIEIDVGYDDNIGRTQNNTTSSTFGLIKPELQWIGVMRKHLVRIGYQGEYANFFSHSSENYLDHFLGADVTLDLTQKATVNAGISYREGHEERSAAAGGVGAALNEWDQWAAKIEGLYGRRIAMAQVGASYEHRSREYTNNAQNVRDNDVDIVTLIAFYNLGPKTQLLIEPIFTKTEYTDPTLAPAAVQDSSERKIRAGVTWNATAKTTGKFKIGRYSRDYDNFADVSGMSLDAEVIWKPKTYSVFTFKASRDAVDASIGVSSSYEASTLSVDWKHDLTGLTQLQAGASMENQDYNGIAREDDFSKAYLGVSHAITRNMTVGARYEFRQRDSSIAGNDFDANIITLGLRTTFD